MTARPTPAAPTCPPGAAVRTLRVDRIAWHVVTMGSGPPLLAVHGAGASSESFYGIMPWLAERFTVVAPDLPGHAASEAPPSFDPSLPEIAAALGRLVQALEICPQVAVGHSAGAALIAQATLDGALSPRALVGVAAAMVPFRGVARAVFPVSARWLSASVAPQLLAAFAGRRAYVERVLRGTGSRPDDAIVERYRRLAASPSHVAAVLTMMARWELEPLHAALPRLDVPFLLLAGDDDRAVPLEQQRELAARLPRARLRVVRGAGHLVHEERPARVAALVREEVAKSVPGHGLGVDSA